MEGEEDQPEETLMTGTPLKSEGEDWQPVERVHALVPPEQACHTDRQTDRHTHQCIRTRGPSVCFILLSHGLRVPQCCFAVVGISVCSVQVTQAGKKKIELTTRKKARRKTDMSRGNMPCHSTEEAHHEEEEECSESAVTIGPGAG